MIIRATRDNPSESLDAIAAAPPREILARLASANAVLMNRAARPIALGEGAVLINAELRPLREEAQRRLRVAFGVIADTRDEAGLLRAGAGECAATIYAISSESTYLRMTDGVGLSCDEYATWLTDTLTAILLNSEARAGPTAA